MVRFDVKGLTHAEQSGQNWVGENYHQENQKVDRAYAKKEKALASLTIVELTQARNDRKHCRDAWIAWWL